MSDNDYLRQVIKELLDLIEACKPYLVMAGLHGGRPTLEESKRGEAIIEKARAAIVGGSRMAITDCPLLKK